MSYFILVGLTFFALGVVFAILIVIQYFPDRNAE